MENIEIEKEKEEEGETIYNHREYNIKDENNDYILRLEEDEKNITISISLKDNIEYNYKTKMSLLTIVNKLELNLIKYSNLELILKLFDALYENNKIIININNIEENCILLIKLPNPLEQMIKYEIKLYKNYMKVDDKFNMLFNQFKLFKNIIDNNDKINEMNNEINQLNTKLEQRDKEIKDILNQRDNVINELNKKIINQEIRIKDLENKNINIL